STGTYPVTAVWVHLDPVLVDLTFDGERIETTPHHPFFTQERGWVDAGALQLGAHIRKADGSMGMLQTKTLVQRPQLMYNLTVAAAHTFFVGDGQWLVHNTGCYDLARRLQRLRPIGEPKGATTTAVIRAIDREGNIIDIVANNYGLSP